ncbi:MAG: hypothetical protein IJ685_09235 [Selenomonadaceae bacterium]|nr:hypothetical protein [Selenomonadaceae bacterium]
MGFFLTNLQTRFNCENTNLTVELVEVPRRNRQQTIARNLSRIIIAATLLKIFPRCYIMK